MFKKITQKLSMKWNADSRIILNDKYSQILLS